MTPSSYPAFNDLLRLLPGDGEPVERFVSSDLSPTEIMALTGRGLSVTGEVLDGIAHDLGRVKALVRLMALFGRVLVGLARLLTPGGIEGTIYRHWAAIAVLVDVLLFLLATLVPSGLRLALVATGYTLAATVVVETARFVAQRTEGLARRALFAFVGLGILFFAMYAVGDWIFAAKASPGFWARLVSFGGPLAAFAFGAALLAFAGLVWARIADEERSTGSVVRGIAYTVAPVVVLVHAALLLAAAVAGPGANWPAWLRFALFALVSVCGLAGLAYADVKSRERKRIVDFPLPSGEEGAGGEGSG